MSDIESIGISLVLENGVAEGLRRMERDLALFDRATEQRAAKMQSLALAHLPRFAATAITSVNTTAAAAPSRFVSAEPVEAHAADRQTDWLPRPIPRLQPSPLSPLAPPVQRPVPTPLREFGRGKTPTSTPMAPAAPPAPKPRTDMPRPARHAIAAAPSAAANTPRITAKAADQKAPRPRIAITTSARATHPPKIKAEPADRAAALPKQTIATAPSLPQRSVVDRAPVPVIKPRPPHGPSVTVSLSPQEPKRPAPRPSPPVTTTNPTPPQPERQRPAAPLQSVTRPEPKPTVAPHTYRAAPPPTLPPAVKPPLQPVMPPAFSQAAPARQAPPPVEATPAFRDIAPSAPRATPETIPLQGELSINGAQIGRWLAETVARQVARPPTAARRFNSRMMPNWPGYTN